MNFIKPQNWSSPSDADVQLIGELLEKEPQGEFQILVRDENDAPLVIENSPFFDDATPMPTRYWLLPSELFTKVSILESAGGIKKVQEEIDLEDIQKIHEEYERGRNALIDPSYSGPRPSAGVGGTRRGVKCLHAHVANLLAGNDDAVGQWAMDRIQSEGSLND